MKLKDGTEFNLLKGWAGTPYQQEAMEYCAKRFGELRHLYRELTKICDISYGKHEYRFNAPKENLTIEDLAIVCDHGNLCFGGYVERTSSGFRVGIYTD